MRWMTGRRERASEKDGGERGSKEEDGEEGGGEDD